MLSSLYTCRSTPSFGGAGRMGKGAGPGEDPTSGAPERWAMVIGNEGRGVRSEILEVATAVSIPMPGGTESLNAGVAGAILLYAMTVDREPS